MEVFDMQFSGKGIRLIRSALTISAAIVSAFSCIPLARGKQGGQVPIVQGQSDAAPEGGEIGFQALNAVMPGKIVKGAPYSAVATTEMTQQSSDGNQIKENITSNVYRDRQGRTRQEENVGGHSVVFISDPVSRWNYILQPDNKIARKMLLIPANSMPKIFPGNQIDAESDAPPIPGLPGSPESEVQESTQPLGQEMIEGVVADGKRTTVTMPAGAAGNQGSITMVTEKWFSPELRVVVLQKTTVSQVGETIYRLANIRREEPPAILFSLPADYVVEGVERMPPLPALPGHNNWRDVHISTSSSSQVSSLNDKRPQPAEH
jgi:hypothetical protein